MAINNKLSFDLNLERVPIDKNLRDLHAAVYQLGLLLTTFKGTTANRPSLLSSQAGIMYFDTTLAAAGKPIWWTGTNWVDSTGTIV